MCSMDRKIEKKFWTLRRIVTTAFVVIFIALVSYPLIFGKKGTKLNVDVERITISTITRAPFLEFIPTTGTVIPINTFNLEAMEGGRVKEIFLESGSFVNEGDRILELENKDLELDVVNRQAQYDEQENSLWNARLQLEQNIMQLQQDVINSEYQIRKSKRIIEQNEQLYRMGAISQLTYEQMVDDYENNIMRNEFILKKFKIDSLLQVDKIEQLEKSLNQAKINLDFVKEKQKNLILAAPISGLLTSLDAEIGQSIGSGQRIGQIDVVDEFKVRTGIDEYHISRIGVGQTGTFQLDGKEYDLIIKKVYPEVRNNRFEIDLEFAGEAPPDIRRGQTLHIRLALGDLSDAILLPTGGFFQKTGGNWVYVVDESGATAEKRFIKLGRRNPEAYEVLEGLQPGERVITSSYDNFGDIDILILK